MESAERVIIVQAACKVGIVIGVIHSGIGSFGRFVIA